MRAILSLLLIAGAVQAAELRVNRGILPGGLIDDRRLLSELNRHAKQLREEEGTVKASELLKQLERKQCALTLQQPGTDKLTSAQIAERNRKGVLVVSGLYKCQHCPHWQQPDLCRQQRRHAAPCSPR